jgi:hypothetical protein
VLPASPLLGRVPPRARATLSTTKLFAEGLCARLSMKRTRLRPVVLLFVGRRGWRPRAVHPCARMPALTRVTGRPYRKKCSRNRRFPHFPSSPRRYCPLRRRFHVRQRGGSMPDRARVASRRAARTRKRCASPNCRGAA